MEIYKTETMQTRTDIAIDNVVELHDGACFQIFNSRKRFILSDFQTLVSNVINDKDVANSMNSLVSITSLNGFKSDNIKYQTEFILKLVEILNLFLKLIDYDGSNDVNGIPDFQLFVNTAKLLANMWNIKSFKPELINDDLIKLLILNTIKLKNTKNANLNGLCGVFSVASISALANLSTYIPTHVILFVTPDLFEIIETNICSKSSYGLKIISLKLVLSFVQSDNVLNEHSDFSTILPPILVQSLKSSSNKEALIYGSKALLLLFEKFNDISLACALKNELIENILLPFRYADRTVLANCFSILLFCINRIEFLSNEKNLNESQIFVIQNSNQIFDVFYSTEFTHILIKTVIQHYSESSSVVFNLIEKMMDQMWRVFFNEGLIREIIIAAPGIEFHNKEHSAKCITRFFEIISPLIGDESQSFEISPKVNKYCSQWRGDDENSTSANTDDESFNFISLSNSNIRYCVAAGGGLSFLISMLTSIKDSCLLRRMFQIIYIMISSGPPDFAQIAENEDLLECSDSVEKEISGLSDRSEDLENVLQVISLIFKFFQK
ncbi:hypothetical protein M9Y10_001872 [Tritrichomonas musculus]|uniref:Uncharacterized protein n=1 Tax=Tritrichomonas musculus TaxID=1915356 RepID=A0ABR2L987_9EUKA